MTIIDHIQYLICRHDCVVVAGLGAFVSQYVPAHVSDDGTMLLPPSRSLVFNNMISHDDGLLTGSVARREGISYDEARRRVAQEVETLLGRIEVDGMIELPRIGKLTRTAGAACTFIPAEINPIVNMRYEALPEIAIPASMVEAPEDGELLHVDVRGGRRWADRLKVAGRYAAAVALLAVMGATLTTPVIVDRQIDYASLAPAVKPAKKILLPAPVRPEPPKTVAPAAAPQVEDAVGKVEKVRPAVISVKDLDGGQIPEGYDCYIVIASCGSRSEARRYVASHGGSGDLRIIEGDGRYRVYSAVSNDYDTAFAFKTDDPDFSRRHPSAWVLRN